MPKAFFTVRSVVIEPLREKFGHWYSQHHLPMALAGPGGTIPAIMPERLAATSPHQPV